MLSKTPKDVIFGTSSLKIPFRISINVWSLFCSPPLHPVGEGGTPALGFWDDQT